MLLRRRARSRAIEARTLAMEPISATPPAKAAHQENSEVSAKVTPVTPNATPTSNRSARARAGLRRFVVDAAV